MLDVLTLLTADHNRVRGLFARFEKAKESEDQTMLRDLASTINEELVIHTTVEEEIFYPWARGLSDELQELIDEGIEEHHVAKVLLDEIGQVEPGSDEWLAKAMVLMEAVEHHATEEEDEMFPKIRSATGDGDLEALAQQVDARKGQLGAPPLEPRLEMSMEQLTELAREQEIPGRSTMSHDELAATVAPPSAA